MNQNELIKTTYQMARVAISRGNHPFAALLVIDEEIVLTSENSVITDNDVTQHAELKLVSKASRSYNTKQLSKATLYTSTEPCAMCSGAIFWSGIGEIVFGCSAETLAKYATGSFVVPSRELLSHGNRNLKIIGPILENDGSEIHKSFWGKSE